jgi:spermidine synthase
MNRKFFAILFGLSGLCGLVYQILWTRLFSLVLGNTYYAISIIVAAFLFGLFFGAWQIGILIKRCRNELKWYATLELIIGGYALFLLAAHSFIEEIYRGLNSLLGSVDALHLFGKLAITTLLLLVPTAAMGATLPLVVQYFTSKRKNFLYNIGFFYSVNTFGGMIGVLVAGFLIIELLGVRSGLVLAALTNILIGLVVLGILKKPPAPQIHQLQHEKESIANGERKSQRPITGPEKFLYWSAAGLAGFAALSYELIWIRGLKFLIHSSTYSFTIILAIFLAGIAIGSILSKRIVTKAGRSHFLYGILQLALGVYAVFTIYLFYSVSYSHFFQENVVDLIHDFSFDWLWGIAASVLICSMMFLLPTVIMGILFPLLNGIYYDRTTERAGRSVSSIYAISTIGSIVGSLAAGFFLLPAFGIKIGIILVSIINFILGIVFIVKARSGMLPVLVIAALLITGVFSLSMQGGFLMGRHEKASDRVLFYEEGLLSTVKVFERQIAPYQKDRYMSIDGVIIASTARGLLQKEKLIAHLPFFVKPDISEVLSVGLASGISSGSMSLHESVENIDCVEIMKPVFQAARYFSDYNRDLFENEKINLVHDDVYAFLKYSDKKYDLISSDGKLSSLASANTIMLAADYFHLCKSRLKDDGIFVQWVPTFTPHEILKVIMDTLRNSYEQVALFYFYPSDLLMIASDAPILLDQSHMDRVLKNRNVWNEVSSFHLENSLSILSSFMGFYDSDQNEEVKLNTFDRPILEFAYMREWKRRDRYSGGYRGRNMEFLIENFRKNNTDFGFAEQIRLADDISYQRSLYEPSLRYFIYDATNLKGGNFERGLRAYVDWKNNLN